MTTLGFTIRFYSRFRVGGAYARDGIHAAADHDDPLPADHLKGLMRAAAVTLLQGEDNPAVSEVFGSVRRPSPWSWSSAVLPDGASWNFDQRYRVQIDAATHSAKKGQLVFADTVWAQVPARFEVIGTGPVGDLPEADHLLVLRCAAAAVHGLGSWRRRGFGWVGIVPDEPVTKVQAARIVELAGEPR